jgi:hypothetical protein
MPLIHPCLNFDVCKHGVDRPNQLCDDCKRAARILERDIRENERLERMQSVAKNAGLRRHKSWWTR